MTVRPEWRLPATPATDRLFLNIETVRPGLAVGWVGAISTIDRATVEIDGSSVSTRLRTVERPDIDGGVGFIVTFAVDAERRPKRVVLRVTSGQLEGTVRVECDRKQWKRSLIGRLERIDERCVTGWIVDPGARRSLRRASLAINDVPTCVVEASVDRADVQQQYGVDGPCGVVVELPHRCRPGDVVTMLDASGGVLDRLIVPMQEADDAPVSTPLSLPGLLLEHYRHDHNADFLLIRGPGFRVQRSQRGPLAASARRAPERSALAHQLDHIALRRPADEHVTGWLEELDRAVSEVGHHYRQGSLLLGVDDLERAMAADDAHQVRGRPVLTAWQRARLVRSGHRPPGTDDELALFLTTIAVDLRRVGNGLSLLTDEQVDWLCGLVDPWHALPITRYLAARRSVVPHWRDSFSGDDELSRAGLLCQAFADEMCNGFGWTFFGALAQLPDIVDALSAAVLAFSEGGWPQVAPEVTPEDVVAFRRSLNAEHPLAARGLLAVPSVVAPVRPHHSLVGLIGHGSAVGHNATLSERALAAMGMDGPVVSLDHSSPDVGAELLRAGEAPSSWVLLHSQPDYVPAIMANGWDYLGRAAHVIGYMAWETTTVPESLHPGVAMVDEIWTPSEFSAAGLRTATTRDVHVVPHAFLPEEATALLSAEPASSDGPFTVLTIVDAHSGLQRKNVAGMIDAFTAAFDGDPRYRMVMRIRNFAHVTEQARRGDRHAHDVLARIAASRSIDIVSGEMSRAEVLGLYRRSHCYLSLHRAEGFGYTMAEAMMAGVPVVATGYSGNLEYMNADTALLVEHETTSIRRGEYLFWAPGMQWADPCTDHAASLLRQVASDPVGSRARAMRAREDVAHRLSFEKLVARFKELLDGR